MSSTSSSRPAKAPVRHPTPNVNTIGTATTVQTPQRPSSSAFGSSRSNNLTVNWIQSPASSPSPARATSVHNPLIPGDMRPIEKLSSDELRQALAAAGIESSGLKPELRAKLTLYNLGLIDHTHAPELIKLAKEYWDLTVPVLRDEATSKNFQGVHLKRNFVGWLLRFEAARLDRSRSTDAGHHTPTLIEDLPPSPAPSTLRGAVPSRPVSGQATSEVLSLLDDSPNPRTPDWPDRSSIIGPVNHTIQAWSLQQSLYQPQPVRGFSMAAFTEGGSPFSSHPKPTSRPTSMASVAPQGSAPSLLDTVVEEHSPRTFGIPGGFPTLRSQEPTGARTMNTPRQRSATASSGARPAYVAVATPIIPSVAKEITSPTPTPVANSPVQEQSPPGPSAPERAVRDDDHVWDLQAMIDLLDTTYIRAQESYASCEKIMKLQGEQMGELRKSMASLDQVKRIVRDLKISQQDTLLKARYGARWNETF